MPSRPRRGPPLDATGARAPDVRQAGRARTLSDPGGRAANVACPILFAVCERDSVAPPGPTQKYAARAPRGEIKLYDAGHFDVYVGEDFERNVTDQLAFLARHVPVA
ncbi:MULTISPECIES: hypothetical protein [unclassified Streptomyces]|uniref:hypothetical protein n=1 Tax=unclassified Streptomyces TaxID=2593676 RepID=UPI0035E2D9A7